MKTLLSSHKSILKPLIHFTILTCQYHPYSEINISLPHTPFIPHISSLKDSYYMPENISEIA